MFAFDCLFPCDDHDPRVWCDILNFEVARKVYFDNIYDCMLTKNDCNLICKIRHGVWWYIIGIPASSHLAVYVRRLGNWICAHAKIAVFHSRHNKNRSSGTHFIVTVFQG